MRLLLTGATGVAGLAIYRAAVSDPAITHITILTRRPIPSWAVLPTDAASKTTVVLHNDFKTYAPELSRRLAANDACIWALGKSVVGMDEKEYTQMTHGFVMAALHALKEGGVSDDRTDPFRFVFISGEQADPTGKSGQMWARVKGKAEVDVAEFCRQTPPMKAHIFRPGYFFPSPKYPEDRKNQRSTTAGILDRFMTPLFSWLAPSLLAPTEELGQFVLDVAKGRWPDQELFRNKDMRVLMGSL